MISSKYPISSVVIALSSTLEIKQIWLYNEWAPECQFSRYIRPHFPNRDDLASTNVNPNVELIRSVFDAVRGNYSLWQTPREEAKWKKIVVHALPLEWVEKNVEVLYPSTEHFPITELVGIVLWKNPQPSSAKRYNLYEGNHRISTWLRSRTPPTVPAVIYVGKPKR